jgi:hypothetical protein
VDGGAATPSGLNLHLMIEAKPQARRRVRVRASRSVMKAGTAFCHEHAILRSGCIRRDGTHKANRGLISDG